MIEIKTATRKPKPIQYIDVSNYINYDDALEITKLVPAAYIDAQTDKLMLATNKGPEVVHRGMVIVHLHGYHYDIMTQGAFVAEYDKSEA